MEEGNLSFERQQCNEDSTYVPVCSETIMAAIQIQDNLRKGIDIESNIGTLYQIIGKMSDSDLLLFEEFFDHALFLAIYQTTGIVEAGEIVTEFSDSGFGVMENIPPEIVAFLVQSLQDEKRYKVSALLLCQLDKEFSNITEIMLESGIVEALSSAPLCEEISCLISRLAGLEDVPPTLVCRALRGNTAQEAEYGLKGVMLEILRRESLSEEIMTTLVQRMGEFLKVNDAHFQQFLLNTVSLVPAIPIEIGIQVLQSSRCYRGVASLFATHLEWKEIHPQATVMLLSALDDSPLDVQRVIMKCLCLIFQGGPEETLVMAEKTIDFIYDEELTIPCLKVLCVLVGQLGSTEKGQQMLQEIKSVLDDIQQPDDEEGAAAYQMISQFFAHE